MEPPREHGGMEDGQGDENDENDGLQWSRRVNTAECPAALPVDIRGAQAASMEPPREHGGMSRVRTMLAENSLSLQWSRRVNTAECCGGASSVGGHQEPRIFGEVHR